ncbi:glycosyltransferase 61 family protein [Vibrio sp. 10N]|uniref:glycosyltransferase 61 family protein n=1 Tax=Vibrio sp. 10N TaxID=3058938 RepID=UPI0028133216|nr:hypothetical protein VB10N_29220 [Vibrio sp. 10N]
MIEMNYQDPVARRVKHDYSLKLKDHITPICGSDISDTRLYQSSFTKFTPRYQIEDNVLLLPYNESYHIPSSGFFEHWAYDKHLNPILIADHYKPVLRGYRDHSQVPIYPFRKNLPKTYLSGSYYYMGMLNPHYGHFIQESITRIWLALKKPGILQENTKFVFHVFSNFTKEAEDKFFQSNLMEFCHALGLQRENITFVREPTIFEHMVIPESSISVSDGNCYLSDEAKHVWNTINRNMSNSNNSGSNPPNKKIYLSRKAVKNPIQGRILENEGEVERFFEISGFDIVTPELLTQKEMQTILSETSFIAGNPGSGLQNSFFIPHAATTLGLTCLPIMRINPGLNHQVNTDLICGHRSLGYCTPDDLISVSSNEIKWRIDIENLERSLELYL